MTQKSTDINVETSKASFAKDVNSSATLNTSISDSTGDSARDSARGIYFIVAATFLFSVMDGLIKWTGASYPVMQLIFFRTIFAMIPICVTLWQVGGFKLLKTEQPFMHFIRGTVGMTAMFFVFTSFIKLPMAEVVSIFFAVPIIGSVMAVVFLGEKIGIHRGMAIIIGFIGVLVIVQPGPEILSSDTIYPVVGAILMATAMLLVRVLGRKDHSAAIAFYFTAYGVVVSSIGLAITSDWVTPSFTDLLLLISIGILGGVAQYLANMSVAVAEVALVSPFKYTALIWSASIAYVIWGEVPAKEVWIGASIIVASSLYILHREIYWSKKDHDKERWQQRLRAKLVSFFGRT
ncbi:MAG: DMT family transporter [Alphaproteobacteria bacterium]|nr:DMT family transporter [Alphaproteobacteria bacterium]